MVSGRKDSARREGWTGMIHMSQVKVPVKLLIEKVPADLVKSGVIGEEERQLVQRAAAKLLKINPGEIKNLRILRKSVDARKKQEVQMIYQVEFQADREKALLRRFPKIVRKGTESGDSLRFRYDINATIVKKSASISGKALPSDGCAVEGRKKPSVPLVVGFGPAGMFAALTLARAGLAPHVVERGQQVEERQRSVDAFWETGVLNPESNVQFGEGGAGTFSDGKLNTLVKDKSGRNGQVLRTFADFGAPGEILYLQKPHIGTDLLKDVVRNIREEILHLGGRFSFETKLADIEIREGQLVSAVLESGGRKWTEPCSRLVLATGHSARDTFYRLHERGIRMEPKSFAVGVRVEHPQEMIGRSQYGAYCTALPAADYKLTHQAGNGRGVYSFCMCPGGYVVNASSEEGRLAVNGMSFHERAGDNANSAIIATVTPEDFGQLDVLAGIAFQRKYEELAYRQAGGKVPVQLLGDFIQNRKSTSFGGFFPSMRGNYALGNVREILPEEVGDAIMEGMAAFGRKIQGFDREDAILSGIESRTSSPLRILRDDSLQGNIRGIYPCGEGAGYAGGITSAAMDGIRVAEKIIGREEQENG